MKTLFTRSFKIILLAFFFMFPFLLFGQNKVQDQKKIDDVIAKVFTFEVNYKPVDLRHIATKLIEDSEKINYNKGLAYGNYFLGRVFISLLDNKKSIYYTNLSLNFLKGSKDKALESSNYMLLGACYQQLQFYNIAIQNYKKSLNVVKSEKIDAVAKQQMQSNNYFNISDTYRLQGKYDSAYVYLNKNKSLYKVLKSPNNFAEEASVYMKIGQYFTEKNTLDSAAFYINKSLTLLQGKNHIYESQALKYKGDFYNKKGDFPEAIKYGLSAMEVAEKFNDISSEIEAAQSLQTYYRNVNDYKNLAIYSNRNQQMTAELKKQSDAERNEVFDEILEEKKAESDRIKIIVAVLFFVILITVFFVLGYRRRSNLLAAQKKTIEKKNAELEILTNDLSISNKTIQKTFSIISHDLRNPFQTLLGYTSALAEHYDELTAEKKLSYVKSIRKAAEENYNLTQSLLEWSLKQYQGFELKKFPENLHDLVAHSIKSLAGFTEFKNLKIKNEVEDTSLMIDKEVVATIINNLLTNAIKFAKKDTDVLVVSKQDGASLRITILNQDESLTQERSEYIKTYLSASSKEEEDYNIGFGLKIVKEMANLHDAKVEFESTNGTTEVTLVLNNDLAAI